MPADGQPDAIRDLVPGDVVAERYRIVSILGRGAMGVVYRGEHTTVGRPVAVKVLSENWAEHPAISRRFRAEARAASAAGHPNIIEVLDAGDLDDGRPYLVTELIDGKDLFDIVQDEGPLDPRRAVRVGLGIARALEAAHERGIIHRDLKPENVMLARHGNQEIVKVLDFGIAADTATARRPTSVGQVLGTPTAMAPEQAKGERATPSFDIYALGSVMFEILAGRAPFYADDMKEVMTAKVDRKAPPIADFCPKLPEELSTFIDQCLDRDPQLRPASASEAVTRLEKIDQRMQGTGTGLPNIATDPTLVGIEPAVPSEPIQRRGWGLPAALIVLLLGSLGAWWWSTRADEPTTTASNAGTAASPQPVAPAPTPEARVVPTAVPVEPTPPPPQPEVAPKPATKPKAKPEPRPEPPAVAKPEPTPPPEPKPKPATTTKPDPSASDCERSRKQARQARENHDWPGVLRYTKARACWSAAASERLKLRTKAFMETSRWDQCIATGGKLNGSEAESWVRTCQRRKEME